jgi:hypothetical protein
MGGRYEGFRMGVGFDLVYGIYRLMDPLGMNVVLVMLFSCNNSELFEDGLFVYCLVIF